MNAIAIIATLAVAQAATASKPVDRAELTKVLQGFSQTEGVSLFIDLPASSTNIRPVPHKQGFWSMVYLASMTNRDWRTIGAVQTFSRRRREQPTIQMEAQLDLTRMLNSLNDEDLKEALGTGLNFCKLTANDRAKVLSWAFNWPGFTQTSAYDAPQETFEAFRDREGLTRVQLKGLHKYSVMSPSGRKYEAFSSSSIEFSTEHEPYVAPRATLVDNGTLAPSPQDGELDYGAGEMRTVRELLAQASPTFQRRYRVDERILDNPYFVSGKYTRDRFEQCMRVLLDFEPFRSVEESEELRVQTELLADRLQKIDPRLLPQRGEKLSLSDLKLKDQRAYDRLLASGVNPTSMNVQISPGFFLMLDPGSRQYLGSEDRELNGVTTRVTQHRQLAIGVGF